MSDRESSGESGGQPSTPYEEYSNYTVYDENREKIGKVDDLFIDEYDRPEYMGVKMGALGTKTTLIPMEMVQVNDEDDSIEVSADEDKIKDGPAFDDDQEIDLDYEAHVREHYGLGESPDASERGHFGNYYSGEGDSDGSSRGQETEEESSGSTVGGAAAATDSSEGRERDAENEGLVQRGTDDEEGDSEPEVGAVKIRKRVKVEQPQTAGESSEEVIAEEEVVIEEDTEDDTGHGNAGR